MFCKHIASANSMSEIANLFVVSLNFTSKMGRQPSKYSHGKVMYSNDVI